MHEHASRLIRSPVNLSLENALPNRLSVRHSASNTGYGRVPGLIELASLELDLEDLPTKVVSKGADDETLLVAVTLVINRDEVPSGNACRGSWDRFVFFDSLVHRHVVAGSCGGERTEEINGLKVVANLKRGQKGGFIRIRFPPSVKSEAKHEAILSWKFSIFPCAH